MKKLFLAMLVSLALVCLFAIGVSAATTNEFGTPEILPGMSEKSVFGDDGKEATFTTRVVMFDGTEYHTYPAYYIFTNDINPTTTSFSEINTATGKSYSKTSIIRAEVPHNVKKLDANVFWQNRSVKYVLLPDTLTEISGNTFSEAHGLEWVNIPRDCTVIRNRAFFGCASLVTVDMTNAKSLKTTEDNQFYNCPKLEALIFPEGFEHLGSIGGGGPTYQNGLGSLKKLYLPDSVTYMGTISEMKAIGTFVVPQGVTSLKANQFSYCTGLKTIVVHKGVTSAASNMFDKTFYIENIVYTGTEQETDNAVVTALKSYTRDDGRKPTFTYGNHCEYYYDNVHALVSEEGNTCCGICSRCGNLEMLDDPKHQSTWIFNGGKEVNFAVAFKAEYVCCWCNTTESSDDIGAIFVSNGISYIEDADEVAKYGPGVYEQIKIDTTSLEKYAQYSKQEFDYGIFACTATEETGTPITKGENGKGTADEKTVFASFTGTEYTYLRIKITGLENGASLYTGAYLILGDNVSYFSNGKAGNAVAKFTAVIPQA